MPRRRRRRSTSPARRRSRCAGWPSEFGKLLGQDAASSPARRRRPAGSTMPPHGRRSSARRACRSTRMIEWTADWLARGMAEPRQADALRGARWPVLRRLGVDADRRRSETRGGLAAVDRGRLEPERRRLALHAGRRPRLRRARRRRPMGSASSLVLPLGREARLDQHGAGDQDARGAAIGTRLLRRCIAEVQASGARRRPRCDGARAADLPAAWAFATSTRSRAGISTTRRRRASTARRRRDAAARRRPICRRIAALRPAAAAACERPALLAHLRARQPGCAWVAEDGRAASSASCWAARAGSRARSGRWSPTTRRSALALISHALARRRRARSSSTCRMRMPDLRAWLEAQGAVRAARLHAHDAGHGAGPRRSEPRLCPRRARTGMRTDDHASLERPAHAGPVRSSAPRRGDPRPSAGARPDRQFDKRRSARSAATTSMPAPAAWRSACTRPSSRSARSGSTGRCSSSPSRRRATGPTGRWS